MGNFRVTNDRIDFPHLPVGIVERKSPHTRVDFGTGTREKTTFEEILR